MERYKPIWLILISALIIVIVAPLSLTQRLFVRQSKKGYTKQTLKLEGEEITIIRDDFGVPHVFAATQRGVYFGGGYAVAQDRLYQMERYRRDALGELAEIEGPAAFGRDASIRRLSYSKEEYITMFESLTSDIKQALQAYTDGINFRIEELTSQNNIPADFTKVGISKPALWRTMDSVAIATLMANRYGSGGGFELLNARFLERLREKFGAKAMDVFNDIFFLNDPKAPTTIPPASIPGSKKAPAARRISKESSSPSLGNVGDDRFTETIKEAQQVDVYQYAEKHNLITKLGSFCWALSPSRSASGSAALVGGPQMGHATPSIAHEIHYSAGELNVIGLGIPGIPGVIIGHNNHVAWSLTSGRTDMKDIFIAKLNPQNKIQYFYKGKYHDVDRRTETIKIKGEDPRTTTRVRTMYGVVIGGNGANLDATSEIYILKTSFANNEIKTFEALFGINRAKNLDEVTKEAEIIHTSHNIIAVSVDGAIGYWHCGKPPVRAPGHDPRLPASGSGDQDWVGLTPSSKMPRIINPKQGFLANWNNKPATWWDNGDYPRWGEIYEVSSIARLISSSELMTFEQILDIARVISARDSYADRLKPYLLAAIDKTGAVSRDKRVREAANYLRAWDNQSVDGSTAKAIYDAWYKAVREVIFGDELGWLKTMSMGGMSSDNPFDLYAGENLLLHALDGPKSGLPPSRDYLNGRIRDEALIEALIMALNDLSTKHGPQMNLWRFNQGLIDIDPLAPIPGGERATYTLAVEASKPDFRSVSILPPGQSEILTSPHYNDQREMASYWYYKPMLYRRGQLERALANGKPDGN